MATNIATLAVKFTADTSGLKAGAAQAGGSLKGLGSVIGSGTSGLGGVFGSLTSSIQGVIGGFTAAGPAGLAVAAAFVAVGAGAFAAYRGFQQFLVSAERIDKTSKLATRLDLTYGSLQKLTFIAGRSGVEVDALAKAMEKMGREMGSGGMSMEDRFAQQAKRIGEIKDPAKRAAEAYRIFGKAGTELIPLMKNLAQDAARFDRFGKSFGFKVDDKDAKNVERMNDAWGDLVFIGAQLADKFVSKFGGPVAAFLENGIVMLEEWASHLGAMGITWEDVGGFAHQTMRILNGLFSLGNSLMKEHYGLLLQIYGAHQKIAGILSLDKSMMAAGDASILSGKQLRAAGQKGTADFFSGKTGRKFDDAVVNGTDFGGGNRGGILDGGGKHQSFGSFSFDRDSQSAARLINSQGTLSPAERHAAETAKNTAATKAAVDKLITFFISNPPMLGLGGA